MEDDDLAVGVCFKLQALGGWGEIKSRECGGQAYTGTRSLLRGQAKNINRSTVGGLIAPVIDLDPKKTLRIVEAEN